MRIAPDDADRLAATAIRWYDAHARDLPWRRGGTSPWAVLVSEIMLQQTPVARVIPAYDGWLARWPTPSSLAADAPGETVRMWGKLGYPRRALRLREAAVAIRDRHDGMVPDDLEALLALPGVGAYTARAVAAFAFGQRVPVVDTNVRRVLARAVHGTALPGASTTARDLDDALELLPAEPDRAAHASVAFMEIGAVVCASAAPRCPACPLRDRCAWLAAGSPAYDGPVRRPQRFAGTDRQVRGLLLDVLRGIDAPVSKAALDIVWADPVQRERALDGLVVDGLLDPLSGGRYALPAGITQDGPH
ncbi:MAG: A/G-specific adenine glycosylase [Mycobacteriales bacterium]